MTDDADEMPERVYYLRGQVTIETRTPTGPLPVGTAERIVMLGPDDYGPVIGKTARSWNRRLSDAEGRGREEILRRVEDVVEGRDPSGLNASLALAEAARWRAAFESLHARVHRDFNFDAGECAPPEGETALRMMDDLVTFADQCHPEIEDVTR